MKKFILLFILLCPLALRAQGWSEYQVQKDTLKGTREHIVYQYKGEGFTFRYWDITFRPSRPEFQFELELEKEPYTTIQKWITVSPFSEIKRFCKAKIGIYDADKNCIDIDSIYLGVEERDFKVLYDPIKYDPTNEGYGLYLVKPLNNSQYIRILIPLAGTREDLDIWIEPKQ